jgi:hypothetical protein
LFVCLSKEATVTKRIIERLSLLKERKAFVCRGAERMNESDRSGV